MTMLSARCFVDVSLRDTPANVLARAIPALFDAGAIPRVQLSDAPRETLEAIPAASSNICWLEGTLSDLRGWKHVRSPEHGFWVAHVLDLPEDVDAATVRQLQAELGVCIVAPGNDPQKNYDVGLGFDGEGRLSGLAEAIPVGPSLGRDGSLVGEQEPVWLLGGQGVLAVILPELLVWPSLVVHTLPDGTEEWVTYAGGTQAVATFFLATSTRIALGFRSQEEAQEWLPAIGEATIGSNWTPNPFQHGKVKGLDPSGVVVSTIPDKKNLEEVIGLALALLTGDRQDARQRVGLDGCIAGSQGTVPISGFTDLADEIRKRAIEGLDLLARACFFVAASKAPPERRREAAKALGFTLGAKRLVGSLKKLAASPNLGMGLTWADEAHAAEHAWKKSHKFRERTRANGDQLAHLDDQVTRILQSVGGAK